MNENISRKIQRVFVPLDLYPAPGSQRANSGTGTAPEPAACMERSCELAANSFREVMPFSLANAGFTDDDLNKLMDQVEQRHRSTGERAILLYNMAHEAAYQHGTVQAELSELTVAIFFFLHDLLNHMMREEKIVFPLIRQLLHNQRHSKTRGFSSFGLIKEWTGNMQNEHLAASVHLRRLRKLTNHYTMAPGTSETYAALSKLLQEFEVDFWQLMHLEDQWLFPGALIADGESDIHNYRG